MFDEKPTHLNSVNVFTRFCYFVTDSERTFNPTVITLSCIVFVLLVVVGLMIWRARRALPNNRATTASDKAITDSVGNPDSPRDQHVPEPGSHMELHRRPSEGQSRAPPEYVSLQGRDKNPECYNTGLSKRGNGGKRISAHDQHVSEPATYMEPQPRPSEGQSHAFPVYYNVEFKNREGEGKLVLSPHSQHASEQATYMEPEPRPLEGQSLAFPEYKSPQGTNKNPLYYNVEFKNRGSEGKLVLSPHSQYASEQAEYMELQPRSSEGQSHTPEYESLQGTNQNPVYYNVGFNKENK